MHRLHFDQMELLSTLWERLELAPDMPPALVKWDVSPLCVPPNTGGFCVCVCVSKRSWGRSSKSVSAWFASLHTNAAQCQSFIQKHSPTDSCCNILYDEKEEGGHPPWVSKLICPLPLYLFRGNINWTYLISHSMAALQKNTYSIKYHPIKSMNGPFWSRAGRFSCQQKPNYFFPYHQDPTFQPEKEKKEQKAPSILSWC